MDVSGRRTRDIMIRLKETPKFNNLKEEREFWDTHDLADYFDMSSSEEVAFPNLDGSGWFVRYAIPDDIHGQLSELAAARKKTLAEMIGLILQSGLKKMRVSPSQHGSKL